MEHGGEGSAGPARGGCTAGAEIWKTDVTLMSELVGASAVAVNTEHRINVKM